MLSVGSPPLSSLANLLKQQGRICPTIRVQADSEKRDRKPGPVPPGFKGEIAAVRLACASCTLAQKHMCRAFACDVPNAFITQGTHIDAAKKMFANAEQDRPDGEMQLVN